ncbi:MORN repeat protein [Leptospira wolffii]|uniref:MORN repeat protein n=1 Tax=Leptospira wolffii TaxID=409998 RepID=UPI00030793CB|nr:MORN repeat protein [Leptospira wolffii]EPG66450.1 MORN repeat protein [Leptospira wolffii serovar Khorat str. Khorat-H2]
MTKDLKLYILLLFLSNAVYAQDLSGDWVCTELQLESKSILQLKKDYSVVYKTNLGEFTGKYAFNGKIFTLSLLQKNNKYSELAYIVTKYQDDKLEWFPKTLPERKEVCIKSNSKCRKGDCRNGDGELVDGSFKAIGYFKDGAIYTGTIISDTLEMHFENGSLKVNTNYKQLYPDGSKIDAMVIKSPDPKIINVLQGNIAYSDGIKCSGIFYLIEQSYQKNLKGHCSYKDFSDNNQLGILSYEGNFYRDSFDGLGELTFKEGYRFKSYKGHFKNGKYDGKGVLEYSDGSKYEGEFQNSKRHGFGILYNNTGKIEFKGKWSDDQEVR